MMKEMKEREMQNPEHARNQNEERKESMGEERKESMNNENLPTSYSPVNNNDDGFDDYDDGFNSIIRGTRLKFTNTSEWLTKDGEAIPPDRELLVIKTIRVVQKWVGGKPETHILAKDEPFPDVKQLNDAAPPHEWREVFGQKKGPCENAFVVYLLDPKAMRAFTFVTATTGGFRAVRELKEQIRIARKLQDPNLFPLVTLTNAFMPTQYGGRQRPHFEVKRFVPIDPGGGGERQLEKPGANGGQPPQIENKPAVKPTVQTALDTFAGTAAAKKDDPKTAEAKKSLHNELNDKIPF
jgi:hypothetical protein